MATSQKCGNCVPELEICNIAADGDLDGNLIRDPENPRNWLLQISYSVLINKIICQAERLARGDHGFGRDLNTPLTNIRIAKFQSRNRVGFGTTTELIPYGEATIISNKVLMRGPYTTKKVCCAGIASALLNLGRSKPCCEIMEEKLFECFKVKKELFKCGAVMHTPPVGLPRPGIVKYSADQGGKMGWDGNVLLSVRGVAPPSSPSTQAIPWLANKNKGQIAAAVRNDLRTTFIGYIQRCGYYQAGGFHIDPEVMLEGGYSWLDCLDCPDSCV